MDGRGRTARASSTPPPDCPSALGYTRPRRMSRAPALNSATPADAVDAGRRALVRSLPAAVELMREAAGAAERGGDPATPRPTSTLRAAVDTGLARERQFGNPGWRGSGAPPVLNGCWGSQPERGRARVMRTPGFFRRQCALVDMANVAGYGSRALSGSESNGTTASTPASSNTRVTAEDGEAMRNEAARFSAA